MSLVNYTKEIGATRLPRDKAEGLCTTASENSSSVQKLLPFSDATLCALFVTLSPD
jgi:hypothetical protein